MTRVAADTNNQAVGVLAACHATNEAMLTEQNRRAHLFIDQWKGYKD
jgi:hypothetical protein